MLKISLIEDNFEYRDVLATEINFQKDMLCQHAFSSVPPAIKAMQASPTDLLILDLGLPKVDGLDAIPTFKKLFPTIKIIILTINEDRARVIQALARGAHSYLLKSDPLERIIEGIRHTAKGEAPMSASIARIVLQTLRHKFPVFSSNVPLTPREIEVLQLLAKGNSRKIVASKLELSTHTINNHVRNIYDKLEVHNLSGALKKASDGGLI